LFRPIEKLVLGALALALAVGIVATVAGGVLHGNRRISCGEGNDDCIAYHNYGWPWEWRTSMPDERLDRLIDNSDRNFFSVNEDGYSTGWFLSNLIAWFAVALTAKVLIVLIGWGVSRLLVKPKGASSA
jgi:hypothetical protein